MALPKLDVDLTATGLLMRRWQEEMNRPSYFDRWAREPGPGGIGPEQPIRGPADIDRVVRAVRYKPGWVFSCKDFDLSPPTTTDPLWAVPSFVLHIAANVPDRETGAVTTIYSTHVCNPRGNQIRDVIASIFNSIRAFEEHEAAEMFRVAGERVYDPHTDRGQAETPRRW